MHPFTPLRRLIILVAIAFGAACSDDGAQPPDAAIDGALDMSVDAKTTDARPDGKTGDAKSPAAACTPACGGDQVCLHKMCVTAGPHKQCGATKFPAGLPAGTTFYVDATASAGGDGSSPAKAFKTIAAALAAIPKDQHYTVAVADGVYQETLTIGSRGPTGKKEAFGADLLCRCPEKVRITGGLKIAATSALSLKVTVDGCTIAPKGFDPDAAADWPACSGANPPIGVDANSASNPFDVLIRDSVIAGFCTGVHYNAGANPLSGSLCLARSRVSANRIGLDSATSPTLRSKSSFTECAGSQEAIASIATRFDRNRDFAIQTRQKSLGIALLANLVELSGTIGKKGSEKTAGAGYGVYLGDTNSASIAANIVRHNQNVGIGLRNENANVKLGITISQNRLLANKVAGIALQKLQAKKGVRLVANAVSETAKGKSKGGGDGILVTLDKGMKYSVVVSGNSVDGSARNGIFFAGVSGRIENNTLKNSGGHGAYLQQTGTSVTVKGNTYGGNGAENVKREKNALLKYGVLPLPLP